MFGVRSWARGFACTILLVSGCGEPLTDSALPQDDPVQEPSPVDTCIDVDGRREARPARPGTVRITEWMANPEGRDNEFEWVEVWFAEDTDLQGLELGPSLDGAETVAEGEMCVPVDAGSWVVFGASPAAAPRVDAELGFSLGNSGSRAIVVARDGVVLDRVDYDGAVEGLATQVDADGTRCDAVMASPGAPNPLCQAVLGAGECFDEGIARAVDGPEVGEASISEWMADPDAVDNRHGEWVEVRFETAIDLNGLTLSDRSGASTMVESEDCIEVAAGAHLVFARELDPSENGGIAVAARPLSFSLNNGDETISLFVDGEELDVVSYESSASGVAIQVDELGQRCAAMAPYGAGDLGTPGAANPSCP